MYQPCDSDSIARPDGAEILPHHLEVGQRAAVDPLLADRARLAVAEHVVEQLAEQALRLRHRALAEQLVGRADRLVLAAERPRIAEGPAT